MPFPVKSFFAKVKIFIFRPKTMDYSPWFVFGSQKKFGEKDTIGKDISRGAEWHKFQLHSTFQCIVMSVELLTPLR